VKVPYMPVPTRQSLPSLGGGRVRYRPVLAVCVTGPKGQVLRDGLLDTGADDAVFTEAIAGFVGVDLSQADERLVGLAGRPRPIRCRYAPVQLRITDGRQETYEWTAVVGFVAGPLHYNLLGQAGFLHFFQADFDGAAREATLLPNSSFPGRRV
jgi:hypothetical protein